MDEYGSMDQVVDAFEQEVADLTLAELTQTALLWAQRSAQLRQMAQESVDVAGERREMGDGATALGLIGDAGAQLAATALWY